MQVLKFAQDLSLDEVKIKEVGCLGEQKLFEDFLALWVVQTQLDSAGQSTYTFSMLAQCLDCSQLVADIPSDPQGRSSHFAQQFGWPSPVPLPMHSCIPCRRLYRLTVVVAAPELRIGCVSRAVPCVQCAYVLDAQATVAKDQTCSCGHWTSS